MTMADHMAADGFKNVGYEFINIDVSHSKVANLCHLTFEPICRTAGHPRIGTRVANFSLTQTGSHTGSSILLTMYDHDT